jgi:three-Cys-motif partner protein
VPEPAEVGPWAKHKLAALRRYLEFYTTVLKKQPWRTIYVDGYAGGGRAVIRTAAQSAQSIAFPEFEAGQIDSEQRELIAGSPRVSLEITNPFDRYVFIEPDPARVSELQAMKEEFGASRTIDVRPEQAAVGVEWVTSQRISKKSHRGVAFLDPFGADLQWTTIQRLADTKLFEVFVNFALSMAIQRMMPNDGNIPPSWRSALDRYFGTESWYDEVYEERQGLFDSGLHKREGYQERLLELYRGRLKDAFGFVSVPKLVRNTKGAPLYYLLWAGPNRKGLEGADYILKMVDP